MALAMISTLVLAALAAMSAAAMPVRDAAAWAVDESASVSANAAPVAITLGSTATYAYCALSEFRMNGIGRCAVSVSGGAWVLTATGTSSMKIACRASCIRADGRTEAVFSAVLNYPAAFPNMGSTNDTLLCGLSNVSFGSNYMGMVSGTCDTYVDRDAWTVTYLQSFSYVQCQGVCLRPLADPTVGQWLYGPYELVGRNGVTALGNTTTLGYCALTTTRLGGSDGDRNDCAVYRTNDVWYLEASADDTFSLRCRAYCLGANY